MGSALKARTSNDPLFELSRAALESRTASQHARELQPGQGANTDPLVTLPEVCSDPDRVFPSPGLFLVISLVHQGKPRSAVVAYSLSLYRGFTTLRRGKPHHGLPLYG